MKHEQKIDDKHYNDLIKIKDDCTKILTECGINPIQSQCTFHFNTSYGRYYPKDNVITVSYEYFQKCKNKNDLNDIYNIIIHEMLHAIAESQNPNSGHRGLWKELAQKVSKNTKYSISRLYNFDLMNEEKYKYIIQCQSCGQYYGFKRRTSFVQEVEMGFLFHTCGNCGNNEFKIIKRPIDNAH